MLSDPVAEAFGLIHRHPQVKISAVCRMDISSKDVCTVYLAPMRNPNMANNVRDSVRPAWHQCRRTASSAHLSVGGNTRGLEMVWPTRHVGAELRGLLGPTAHGLLGRRHPGPPQPHGWVRLGLEVSRFPYFWRGGGRARAHFPRGVEFGAL